MSKVFGMSNGKAIDPYNYLPLRDWDKFCVAKSLSNINRYNGHYGRMSVAEHCILVSQLMGLRFDEMNVNAKYHSRDDWMLIGLLHDSIESVIGDIITPVKHHPMFSSLRHMENHYLKQVYEMHGLLVSYDMNVALAHADKFAMRFEIEKLGCSTHKPWQDFTAKYHIERYPTVEALSLPANDAEWGWLETYDKIQERRNYVQTEGAKYPG